MLIKRPGLPPAADPATFIGFDENREPYVLRWHAGAGCWQGIGFQDQPPDEVPRDYLLPLTFMAREEMADHIVAHVAASEIGQ